MIEKCSRGNPRQPQSIGRHIRRLVEQQLGKRFHVHLARHLAVDVIVEGTDGNLRLAQKLLGHRKERTTNELYGSRVTLAANRKLQDLYRDQAQRVTTKAVRKATTPDTGPTQRRTK